jgi:hypothetical protein
VGKACSCEPPGRLQADSKTTNKTKVKFFIVSPEVNQP